MITLTTSALNHFEKSTEFTESRALGVRIGVETKAALECLH